MSDSAEFLITQVASEIHTARAQRNQLATFSSHADVVNFDVQAAYQVAYRVQTARVAAGAKVVGRKIGFTNRSLWPVYGVHQPVWGALYDDSVQHLTDGQGHCPLTPWFEPKIEPEIVFHFSKAPQPGSSLPDILACIDWLALGFEMVDSPFPAWKFQAPDCIAVGGLHGRLLVGTPMPVKGPAVLAQLESFKLELLCNGQLRDQGTGANVLGSPLVAVAHLMDVFAMQTFAAPLAAGDLVTTGTVTQALNVAAGEQWSARVTGLGADENACAITVEFGA